MTACGNAQIDTNTAKESVKDSEVAYVENYLKDWAKTAIRAKQEQMLLLQMQKQEEPLMMLTVRCILLISRE